MKSIGSSSKMLKEAIGERLSEKTSSAKHKFVKEYKNTKHAMGSWTNDTKSTTSKKLKTVRSKIDNFSLKRNKNKNSFSIEDEERPQTFALGNDEMLQSLQFNSPLNNRFNNLENIPANVSTYEIPKSLNRRSIAELPSYDDVVNSEEFLIRNSNLTQSLYSSVNKPNKPNNLNKKNKNVSDSHLNTTSSDSSDSSNENESQPPSMPAPELPEQIYGRIKKIEQPSVYENAPIIPLRKPPPPPVKSVSPQVFNNLSDSSDKTAHCGSSNDLDSRHSMMSNILVDRSESWRFVDNISQGTVDSAESMEPIYSNDENARMATAEPKSGRMFHVGTTMLTPLKVLNNESAERKSQSAARDILKEFDPLSRESFDAFIMTKLNHLSLLETLLSEETYGTVDESFTVADEEQIENSSVESEDVPTPPERNDSLAEEEVKIENSHQPGPAPKVPHRQKKVERVQSVIIHQNLKLKDSVENLAEPFLAQVEDEPSTSKTADLSRPKPPTTNWFVVDTESEKFAKNNLDNSNNFPHAPTDKLTKTIPHLPKVNNLTANREHLPTYEESKNDEIVNIGAVEKSTDVTKSKSSIFHFGLKRRSSLREKLDEKDFVPRPPFAEDSVHADKRDVVLFKLPSGVIEDILKELNPRFVELKKRQFKACSDPDHSVLKEHLDFTHLTSIHYLVNHKYSEFKGESGRQIYCFEINLAIPKNSSSGSPNALLDSKGLPVKTQRVTYVYGNHTKNEK